MYEIENSFDFGFDVSTFVENEWRERDEETGTISPRDLKAVKASTKTWADIFDNNEE